MGYLDNTQIVIDAILTDKGRELLSRGSSHFKITQFALGDDEVDYNLWNANHTLGADYYGEAIENMPVLEANPNSLMSIKSKLISLPRSTARIPVLDIGQTSIELTGAQHYTVSPSVINYSNANSVYGYTAVISDTSVATLRVSPGYEISTASPNNVTPTNQGTTTSTSSTSGTVNQPTSSNQTLSVVGLKFDIVGKNQFVEDKVTTITITGNETGGSITLVVTVKRLSNIR